MYTGNTLAPDGRAIITKVVSDCANSEIALDSLAQWAFNPTGSSGGYEIEENYLSIKENLVDRFNLSDRNASEVVQNLRAYGTKFMLLATDPLEIRATILEMLQSELGEKWRLGMLKRMSKASNDTKKLAFLILYLMQHGFEINVLENVLDEIQTFHVATFEKPFSVSDRQRDLREIGLLNQLIYTSENSNKQNIHVMNSIVSAAMFGFKLKDLKINTDTKGLVDHLYEKRAYDQLVSYDELCCSNFGIKKLQNIPEKNSFDKKIVGIHQGLAAISPFMLETIRDDIEGVKRRTLDTYELRIDTSLLASIRETWPDGRVDLLHPKETQTLWRLDNAIDPKLYVFAAPWVHKIDLDSLSLKLDVAKVSTLVCVVFNQIPESVKEILKDRESDYGQLLLIYPTSQKEVRIEQLSGASTPFSSTITKSIVRALDLSISTSDLTKTPQKALGVEVGLGSQYAGKSTGPRLLIGMQETKGIYWVPTRERNWNFGVFGESGSGKTQTIKKILSQLKANHLSFLVLDSFGEYVANDLTNPEFGIVISANEISVNPLEIAKGDSFRGKVAIILDTFKAIFNLSEQELSYLQNGIRRIYLEKGIIEDKPQTWSRLPPTFVELHNTLVRMEESSKEVRGLLQKIEASLKSSLFSRTKTVIPFEKLVSGPVVLHLGGMQTNEMKSLASEFILAKVPRYVENATGEPQLFLVVDGTPNLFKKYTSSLKLLMEARSRGIGVIFPYRDPNNLPEIAFNSTATIMTFRQSDSKVAKLTAERLGTTEQTLNKNLIDKFSAVVRFSSMTEVQRLTASPYSQK